MNLKHPQYEAVADIYDPAWGDDRGPTDISAYKRLGSQTNGPILEMGAGTGRVCIELAARGHHVVGLELSRRMAAIAVCKAKQRREDLQRGRLKIVVGDMCTWDTPVRFGLVILPFSALWECGSKAHVKKALCNAYRLLANPGTLFFDCSYYGAGGRQQRPSGEIHSQRRYCGGHRVLIFGEADWFDEASGLTEKWLYTDTVDARGIVVKRRTNCIKRIYLTPEQMRETLARAGFHPDACELFGSLDAKTSIDDQTYQDPTSSRFRKARQVWRCGKLKH